jgi:CheY-like chemotaxis protein
MPVMNGYETAERIRAVKQSLFLVALSAYVDEKVEKKAKLRGFNACYLAPLTEQKI